jgi:hypothetical protein
MWTDYLHRRQNLYKRTVAAGLPSGRPWTPPGRSLPNTVEDTLDDLNPERFSRRDNGTRGMNVLGLVEDVAQFGAELRRQQALGRVLDAVKDQLAPGQTVDVFMSDLDVISGTFKNVSVGRANSLNIVGPDTTVRTVTSMKPGTSPENQNFMLPSSSGTQLAKLPNATPGDARPGGGDLRDYADRWNSDPGTFDLDMDRYNDIARTG